MIYIILKQSDPYHFWITFKIQNLYENYHIEKILCIEVSYRKNFGFLNVRRHIKIGIFTMHRLSEIEPQFVLFHWIWYFTDWFLWKWANSMSLTPNHKIKQTQRKNSSKNDQKQTKKMHL